MCTLCLVEHFDYLAAWRMCWVYQFPATWLKFYSYLIFLIQSYKIEEMWQHFEGVHTFKRCRSSTQTLLTPSFHLRQNAFVCYYIFFRHNLYFILFFLWQNTKDLEQGHKAHWLTRVEQPNPPGSRYDRSVWTSVFFHCFIKRTSFRLFWGFFKHLWYTLYIQSHC